MLQRVRQRRVAQGDRARAADRAGHVRHAVVDDAVDDVRRLLVRRRAGRLDAAALVDGDVDDHRAVLHDLQVLARDQPRGLGAGDQHRADDEVGLEQVLADRCAGR